MKEKPVADLPEKPAFHMFTNKGSLFASG